MIKKGILTILIGTVALAVIAFSILMATRKPLVVLYGLSNPAIAAIKQEAGPSFKFMVIDGNEPISAHKKDISKAYLVFMHDGKAASELSAKTVAPDESILALMPSAMREAGKSGTRRYGIPILFDHFEIDWNVSLIGGRSLAKPKTLTDLVKVSNAIKGKNLWPLVCAGGVDEDLLGFVGALVISESGLDAYEKLVTAASEGMPFAELVKTTALKNSLDTLIEWRKSGIIHPEWFRMKKADVSAFMQMDYACFFAMSLSSHRLLDHKIAEKVLTIDFPTDRKELDRGILAPAIVAIELRRSLPGNRAAHRLVAALAQGAAQANISGGSGLAPANSNATTADKQADDARFWIASSRKPFPDPATAALSDPSARAAFAASIRQYIEFEGNIN
jgi:hypothetical protein